MNDQYLTFFIRAEEYAVSLLHVREIIEYETVTRVPSMPPYVRGVLNLRGNVLPVVDLAARFGHAETTPARTSCIVVVETKAGEEITVVGLLADSVCEVISLPPGAIEPPPSFGPNIRVEFLAGMGKFEGRLLLLLDLAEVLEPAQIEDLADPIPQSSSTASAASPASH